MKIEAFAPIFETLARRLRFTNAEPDDVRSYYDVLGQFPDPALKGAAARIAVEAGRKFMPTSAEWAEVTRTWIRDQQQTAPREWHVECEQCDDTGWERFECTGDETCGRKNLHLPHSYVRVCPCRPTNRTYQRHHA